MELAEVDRRNLQKWLCEIYDFIVSSRNSGRQSFWSCYCSGVQCTVHQRTTV